MNTQLVWNVQPVDSLTGSLEKEGKPFILFEKNIVYEDNDVVGLNSCKFLSVFVIIIHQNFVPYVLLLCDTNKNGENAYGLPSFWLSYTNSQDVVINEFRKRIENKQNFKCELIGTLWRTSKSSDFVSVLPPHCRQPYQRINYYSIMYSGKLSLKTSKGTRIKGAPLFQLEILPKILNVIPYFVSRYKLRFEYEQS